MADEHEPFLARWSRLKREQRAQPARQGPAAPQAGNPAPPQAEKPLPPLDSLTPESDFSAFMQPKVKEELRRLALKKLFRDPHFNVPDPYEPFSGDWTTGEAIAPDLLAELNQTRALLMTPEERKALEDKEQAALDAQRSRIQAKEAKADEPGKQDT